MTSPGFNPWQRAFRALVIAHLTAWTLLPLLAYPNISLDVAEAVAWGHQWQLGYFKHPPLSAWLAETARVLSGSQATWCLYLFAQLVIVAAFWAVWRLAQKIADPKIAFLAVLGLEVSFIYSFVAIEFNVNTVATPFFALAAWFAYEALTAGHWKWWIALGAAVGLGLLSKYIMVLEAGAIGLFILADPASRPWLKRPHPYVALLVCLLVFSPNLLWLIQNHFPSITYAKSRAVSEHGFSGHILNPLDFLSSELGFLAPAAIVFLPWAGIPWRRRKFQSAIERRAARYVIVVCFTPAIVLLLLSAITGMQLRSEWGVPFWTLYPLSLLLALEPRNSNSKTRSTIKTGLTLAAANIAAALAIVFGAPAVTHPRSLRIQFSGRDLSKTVEQLWHARAGPQPLPLVGGERWLSDNVAYYAPDRPSVLTDQGNILDYAHLDAANCPWTSVADFKQRGGILLWFADLEGPDLPAAIRADFPTAIQLGTVDVSLHTLNKMKPRVVGVAVVKPL